MAQRKTIPAIERVLARCVERDLGYASPCFVFQGFTSDGYGRVNPSGSGGSQYAHAVAWEHANGPVPDGLVLDHLCCDPAWCRGGSSCPHRACCNAAHLRVTTALENTLRGNSGRRFRETTHCPRGHAYDEANTYAHATTGARNCRACARERMRLRRAHHD